MNYFWIIAVTFLSTVITFCLHAWISGLHKTVNEWRIMIVLGFVFGIVCAHYYHLSYLLCALLCPLTTTITHIVMIIASRHMIDGEHR